jgi:hypothetical protein
MKTTIREYSDTCNNYIRDNVDTSYVKKNFINILFQLWFTPTLFLSLAQGTYYENNNDFKLIEYIRNYEIINLFLEYFYLNPYVSRSTAILHHILGIIIPSIVVQLQHENVPIMQPFILGANITITTNIMMDLVQTFRKNNMLKVVFFIYYFLVRIILPLPFLYIVSTGHYLYVTPSEYISASLCISAGSYTVYGLNIFWFYKICRIARKLIK